MRYTYVPIPYMVLTCDEIEKLIPVLPIHCRSVSDKLKPIVGLIDGVLKYFHSVKDVATGSSILILH